MRRVGRGLKSHWFWFLVVLVLGFGVRLYKIDNPVADWHSWRQADTSAVSRNFLEYGFNLLYPRFDDLSSVPSGLENPEGWRFVEFPIFNFLQAGAFKVFGGWTVEIWGRLVTIGASLAAAGALYGLMGRYRGERWGVVAAAVYLLLPFNIYFSRVILPDTLAVSLALWALLAFYWWHEDGNRPWAFWVSGVGAAAALLVKPFSGFLLLPAGYLVVRRYGLKGMFKQKRLWIYGVAVLFPVILWRVWMGQFPEGIPHYKWLFNGDGIRLRPAWWRWLFGERLGRLILGVWGVVPFALGLLTRLKEKEGSLRYLVVGAGLYLLVVASGNVRHDYYQIMTLPAVAVVLIWGIYWWWHSVGIPKWGGRAVLGFCLTMGWGMSWYQVRESYKINHPEIVEAGERVDALLPKEAKVIAPYNGDTAFLYQTKRKGWPYVTLPMEQMIDMGAEYYVTVDFDARAEELARQYQVVERTDKFMIIKLEKAEEEK